MKDNEQANRLMQHAAESRDPVRRDARIIGRAEALERAGVATWEDRVEAQRARRRQVLRELGESVP